jgi:hypothetical protein
MKCSKVETGSRPKFISAYLSGLIYVNIFLYDTKERTEMRRNYAVGHASDG